MQIKKETKLSGDFTMIEPAVRMTHNGAPSRLSSDTHDAKNLAKNMASPATQVRGSLRSEPAATK